MLIGCTSQPTQKESDFAKYVNPFIGNADNGHTFPGACAPFGMIQVSPESGNGSWRYCSGFNYEDESILGFGQNHLNGTGCPDMGDILLLPFAGDIAGEYKSKINKETQTAVPGYYSVSLTDFDVDAELTATARTAFHRYTYNSDKTPHLLVDLQSGIVSSDTDLHTRVLSAEVDMPDNKTITGHNYVSVWVKRHIFFVIEFDLSLIHI